MVMGGYGLEAAVARATMLDGLASTSSAWDHGGLSRISLSLSGRVRTRVH